MEIYTTVKKRRMNIEAERDIAVATGLLFGAVYKHTRD